MSDLVYRSPEHDVVEMRVLGSNTAIRNWTRYSLNANYETPTDGWSFTIGAPVIPDDLAEALSPGQFVQFSLNGLVQSSGNIDSVTRNITRSGGTEWTIEGRDVFSPVLDGHFDPRAQFKKDTTLEQLVRKVFDEFPPTTGSWKYAFSSDASRAAATGRHLRRKGTARGHGKASKKLEQCRPKPGEGAFTFLTKVVHRQGLHVFPSVDGSTVVLDEPDFDQEASATLVRGDEGANILDGSVRLSVADQPSIIVADGFSGTAEFGQSQLRAKMVNPFTGFDRDGAMWPVVAKVDAAYPEAKRVTFVGLDDAKRFRWPRQFHGRPLYLHDDTARSQDELACFVRREMALRTRRFLTVSYTLEGHGQYLPDGQFVPYAVDTIVQVRDVPGGIHGRLWVLARTFEKSRGGGTTTRLELIMPGSLQFGGDS